jgi:hypothetical protein
MPEHLLLLLFIVVMLFRKVKVTIETAVREMPGPFAGRPTPSCRYRTNIPTS